MVFLKNKRLGRQTVAFTNPPSIAAGSCVVGQKEGEGPLRKWFDYISDDSYFGQSSWEKAESVMLSKCFALCCDKARIPPSDIQYLFAGDLLNQCAGSTFAARDLPIPYFGVYGAGEIIDDDGVYDFLPEQAALLYPNTPFQGCAVIRALGLNSREGFRLESLRIE